MVANTVSTTHVSLWFAFGLGWAVAVGNGLARFSYALLLPAMRDDLGWSYAQAGWMNTANALGYVVGAVLGYLLLSRLSPSQLFAGGLWLILLSLPATGWSAHLSWLTTARVLSGVGAAWVFSCGSALVAAHYQDNAQMSGTATGLYFAGAGFGIAMAGLVVSPLLAWLGVEGWPQAWLLLGALALLLSIWPLRLVNFEHRAVTAAFNQPLVLRGLWIPLAGYFAFAAGYIVYMTFILAWVRGQDWSWQMGLLVWLTLGLAVAISPFVWRQALDRWPEVLTLSASCAVTLAGTAIPLLDASAASLVISAAVFGLVVFIAPSSVAILVRRSMPQALWAKGMTLFTVVFAIGQAIGQAIGPVAAGWIADSTSLSRSLLFGSVLLMAGALLLLVDLACSKMRTRGAR